MLNLDFNNSRTERMATFSRTAGTDSAGTGKREKSFNEKVNQQFFSKMFKMEDDRRD